MNIIIIVLVLIVLLISTLVIHLSVNKKDSIECIAYFISLICISILAAYISNYTNNSKILAIEVYRGNTELQITYQNNIPIDSVVVYKNK